MPRTPETPQGEDGKPMCPARTPRRALKFADRDNFMKALNLLEKLATKGPLEYNPVGLNTTVLPEWSYRRLAPLLRKHAVSYSELEVKPISDLPPEEQARIRNRNWGKS